MSAVDGPLLSQWVRSPWGTVRTNSQKRYVVVARYGLTRPVIICRHDDRGQALRFANHSQGPAVVIDRLSATTLLTKPAQAA